MFLYFKVNGSCCELEYLSEQEDEYYKLLTDNSYAVQQVMSLINKGTFSINGPVTEISRGLTLDDLDVNADILLVNENKYPTNETFASSSSASSLSTGPSTSSSSGSAPSSLISTCTAGVEGKDWAEAETKFLLNQICTYLPQVGPQKQFKNKRVMWQKIAAEILEKFNKNKTETQVENRYKTVMKRKKTAVELNAKSGNSRTEVPYEEELHKIASNDDSIEPEILRSASGVKRLKEPNSCATSVEISGTSPKVRKTAVTVVEKLQELHNKAEESRMKRHKEKLDLVREMWFGKDKKEQ